MIWDFISSLKGLVQVESSYKIALQIQNVLNFGISTLPSLIRNNEHFFERAYF